MCQINNTKGQILAVKQSWNYENIPVLYEFKNMSSKPTKKLPTDKNAPHMLTIKETSAQTGVSEHHIRQLCKTNKIQYIKTGVKYLINYDRFIDYLNGRT